MTGNKPDAHLETVIVTTLTRRGAGKDAQDPARLITQVWTLDGVLVAEHDPVVKKREGNDNEFNSVN